MTVQSAWRFMLWEPMIVASVPRLSSTLTGDVTIQNNDNEGLVLNREQIQAFVSFVVERMTLEVPQ